MSQASVIAAASKGELVSPEGTQEGNNTCKKKKKKKSNTCRLAATTRQPVPKASPGESQGVRAEGTGAGSRGTRHRSDSGEPERPCSQTKESRGSLTWDTWFSFGESSLSTCLLWQNSCTRQRPCSPPRAALPLPEMAASRTWSPQGVCWIKHNSYFSRLCIFCVGQKVCSGFSTRSPKKLFLPTRCILVNICIEQLSPNDCAVICLLLSKLREEA